MTRTARTLVVAVAPALLAACLPMGPYKNTGGGRCLTPMLHTVSPDDQAKVDSATSEHQKWRGELSGVLGSLKTCIGRIEVTPMEVVVRVSIDAAGKALEAALIESSSRTAHVIGFRCAQKVLCENNWASTNGPRIEYVVVPRDLDDHPPLGAIGDSVGGLPAGTVLVD